MVCWVQVVKVLHGADKDIQWLQRDFGIYMANMFDTGQASRVLEYPGHGLAYLLQHFCAIKVWLGVLGGAVLRCAVLAVLCGACCACCAVRCGAVLCWPGLGQAGKGWAWSGLCCAVLCLSKSCTVLV